MESTPTERFSRDCRGSSYYAGHHSRSANLGPLMLEVVNEDNFVKERVSIERCDVVKVLDQVMSNEHELRSSELRDKSLQVLARIHDVSHRYSDMTVLFFFSSHRRCLFQGQSQGTTYQRLLTASRIPQSSYYDRNNRPSASLYRARQPYLVKNAVTGLAIMAFAAGVCRW